VSETSPKTPLELYIGLLETLTEQGFLDGSVNEPYDSTVLFEFLVEADLVECVKLETSEGRPSTWYKLLDVDNCLFLLKLLRSL